MKYTDELKLEIVNRYNEGFTNKELKELYGVSRESITKWRIELNLNSKRLTKQLNTTKDYDKLLRMYNNLQTDYEILNKSFELLEINKKDKLPIATSLVKSNYEKKRISRVLNINVSTLRSYMKYHDDLTMLEVQDVEFKEIIYKLFTESKERLSYKKMHDKLKLENMTCSVSRVSRLMKELGLKCKRERHKKKTDIIHAQYFYEGDLIKQNFRPTAPNMYWCCDVTSHDVNGNLFHICKVIDLYSRKIIGHSVSAKNNTNLTCLAVKDAFENRKHPTNIIFHSDQGSNYTSNKFRGLLYTFGMKQSFSRVAEPYDNSVIEGYFSNLKNGHLNCVEIYTYQKLIYEVDEYVDYYNNFRPHEGIGNITPQIAEDRYYAKDYTTIQKESINPQ